MIRRPPSSPLFPYPTLFRSPSLLSRRTPAALCARQAVGGGRLGGIGGVLLARRQLPFQIGNLLFCIGELLLGVGDLLIPLGHLLTKFFNLTLLPLDLPPQFSRTWRMRLRITARPCLLVAGAPSRSRIHPPYVKRFGEICPAKSNGIPEIPQKQGREQLRQTRSPCWFPVRLLLWGDNLRGRSDNFDGLAERSDEAIAQIGRASCRERV